MSLSPEDRRELDLLRRLRIAERRNRFLYYRPYPRQYEFHAAGATFRERLLGAGNQLGKSFCGGMEIAMHATGQYPDWWPGKRFAKPVTIWTGSSTNETSKSILQSILLGVEEPNKEHPDWGTGSLPYNTILHTSQRIAGVKGVLDHITVKHISGGTSRVEMKCHPAGERALMADGRWKDVKDIECGDWVRCADGHNRMIDQTHAYANAPVWEIRTRAGSIRATPNHPMFTQRGKVRVDALRVGDILEVAGCDAGAARVEDWRVVWTALMIGDGCLRTRGTPLLTCAEPRMLDAAGAYLPDSLRIARKGKSRPYDYKIVGPDTRPNELAALLREDGLWGKKSGEKFIPDWVFSLCREQRILFLFWLWNTDGTVTERTARYDTTSRRLARDVRLLLWTVGIHAPMGERPPVRLGHNNRYWVDLHGYERIRFDEIGKFDRVSANVKPRPKGARGEVLEIKPVGTATVYGCGVPETHELIVEGFRVGNTYEQGRFKWQGKPVDVVWFDEEPPSDIYSEGVTRTNTTHGIVFTTFTPLLGLTRVVEQFYQPKPDDPPRILVNMTIWDCVGGTWAVGTPWAGENWKGHYTQERAEEVVHGYPEHEREARANGVPMAGEGRVFPVSEDAIKVAPFELPKHWPMIFGLDFGVNHPAAGSLLAWDRHNDIQYLVDCYRMAGQTPVYHAAWFTRPECEWIPVAWPHDGLNAEKSSGRPLADHYRQYRVNMLPMSARYKDDTGGRQDVEPGMEELLERMMTGRFKVFSHLRDFFEEFRNLHRKDGKIVPVKDDVIKAVHYANMMKRYARTRLQAGLVAPKPRMIVA